MKTGDFVVISNPDLKYERESGHRRFQKGTVGIIGDIDRDDSIEVISDNSFWYYTKDELTPYKPYDNMLKSMKSDIERKKKKFSKQENSYQKGVYTGYREGLKEAEELMKIMETYEGIIREYERKLDRMI